MLQDEEDTLWEAAPHTIAKIRILEAYLVAWFQILGTSKYRSGQGLVYIDGFAGPGKYRNFSKGSPVAALVAAKTALSRSSDRWRADKIHCCFIEERPTRAEFLQSQVEPFLGDKQIVVIPLTDTFTNGLIRLRTNYSYLFNRQWPLFAFIDPCGATGVPLSDISSLLMNQTAEVLLNFDADGIGRIYKAGGRANHEALLNEIYSDSSWKSRFENIGSFDSLCREALELYKEKLQRMGVKYVFPFEMRTKANTINYFLLFASRHQLGLVKMKEAMKRVDQSGEYCFSDARIGQGGLFRFDDPKPYAEEMIHRFAGLSVKYSDLLDFALLQSPFIHPKSMLKILEEQDNIQITSNGERKRGTFNEWKIVSVKFKT